MKVYIVYYIPDYIGIDIIKIFKNKSDAIEYCNNENKNLKPYEKLDYEEYDVE